MTEPNNDEYKSVSISLPKDLLEKIDAVAKMEHRKRSNMITVLLREELAEYTTKKGVRPPQRDDSSHDPAI